MLLTLVHRLRRDDDGSALVAVLGLFGVAVIVSLVVSGATIHAMGFTSSTRAGVQAEAAAEAGIDYATAALAGGTCQSSYTPSDHPEFSVDVSYSTETDGDTWADGCPANTAAVRIRLDSVGTATARGVAGQSSGDTRKVEAIFAAAPGHAEFQGSGSAIYSYSSLEFSGSGTLQTVQAAVPNVYVKTGNVTCSGGSQITGNLVAAHGSLTESGSCSIGGSVWTSGKASLTGGADIGGNVVAGTDLSFTGGEEISGSAWATGTLTVGWGATIDGAATATTLGLAGGNVKGSAWARGTATYAGGAKIDGSLTAKSASSTANAKGGTTIVPSGPGAGPVPPPIPSVPGWVDYPYDLTMWPGYVVKTLSGTCDSAAVQTAENSLGGRPGLIDARGCSGGVTLGSDAALTLTGDLAIFAKKFSLGAGASVTSASGTHHAWFITPDSVADGAPTCSSGLGDVSISGNFKVDPSIAAMLYTPCDISEGASGNWYGQMYGRTATLSGAAKLAFVPTGLPGADLDTGSVGDDNGDAPKPLIGSRLSIRDVNAG